MAADPTQGQPVHPAPAAEAKQAKPALKPRPEFRHPVLQAMGIRRLRVPSRNWLIFWAVTGAISWGIWYDRHETRRIRQEWKESVAFLAERPMGALELPRRVKVYIAPPPNDFLDVSLTHFKHYIKPILTAAAVDHELITENQQGHIRTVVAERIRNERRKAASLPSSAPQPDDLDKKIEGKVTRDPTGGVICVGRGAYKEYMSGLQEGWLGPLEEPESVKKAAEKAQTLAPEDPGLALADDPAPTPALPELEVESETVVDPATGSELEIVSVETDTVPDQAAETAQAAQTAQADAKANVSTGFQAPVFRAAGPNPGLVAHKPSDAEAAAGTDAEKIGDAEGSNEFRISPWIAPSDYAQAEVPEQFYRTKHEPIAAMPHPHLLGVLNTPWRLVRYFNQRAIANEMGEKTYAVVMSETRPFREQDAFLTASDEDDWPRKWKENGANIGSEWMREFLVDPRVGKDLRVYEYSGLEPAKATALEE